MINMEHFWRPEDGLDYQPAMMRAAEVSRARRDEQIVIPTGYFRFKRPCLFPTGTPIVGSGGNPANTRQGTFLVAEFSQGPLLAWGRDNTLPWLGTGGMLRDVVLAAHFGTVAECAIAIDATSPERRGGKFHLSNVYVFYASDTGRFKVGLSIDGSKVPVPGGSGTRGVKGDITIAGCLDRAMQANTCVHCYLLIETSPNGGSGNVTLVDCENVKFFGRMYGDLEVLGKTKDLVMCGKASDYRISNEASDLTFVCRPVLNRA